MKKILLVCLAFGISFLSAQKSNGVPLGVVVINPPKVVKDKFEADHPGVHNETWQMEVTNYLADYVDDSTNTEYNIVYDKKGNLIRTDKVLNETSYPGPIKDYHDKYYPNEKYNVWDSQDNAGKRTYYSKHKAGTNYFDQNGNYISTSSESNSK